MSKEPQQLKDKIEYRKMKELRDILKNRENRWYMKMYIFMCRVYYKIFDIPNELKWAIQSITRGYSDKDLWNLDSYIVKKIRIPIKMFVEHQSQFGFSLPNDFSSDPSGWLEVLRKIERSFDLMHEDMFDTPVIDGKESDMNSYVKREKEIEEGLMLFGKYFRSLWD